MRTLRVRFTIGRVVVGLAVLLLVIGAEMLRRRSEVCRERAAHHGFELSRLTAAREDRLRQADSDPAMRAVALFDARRHHVAMAWHADRQAEALVAAWRPWRAIAPRDDQPPWPPIPPELYPAPKRVPPAGPSRLRNLAGRCLPLPPDAIPRGGMGEDGSDGRGRLVPRE